MAKPTLLEIVQDILTEMSGDQVNSISDTQEATDVAAMVKVVWNELIDEIEFPFHKELVTLEGLADPSKPNYMRIPENVSRIEWIKYDTRPSLSAARDYNLIAKMNSEKFVEYVNSRPSTDTSNYQVVQYSTNIPLIIGKLDSPSYWTTFDDEYVVFDSYDSDVESTMQPSNVICSAFIRPTFTVSDDYVPDLPENMFNVLRIHALNRCMFAFKQTINPKTEREENRLRVRTQRSKQRALRRHLDWPDYGRKT